LQPRLWGVVSGSAPPSGPPGPPRPPPWTSFFQFGGLSWEREGSLGCKERGSVAEGGGGWGIYVGRSRSYSKSIS
jgi:hypothetical protein